MGATVLSIVHTSAAASAAPSGTPLASPGSLPGRPRLRSVPTGCAAGRPRGPGLAPLRLTRFARLTVTVTTLAVVIALGVGLTSQLASSTPSTRAVVIEQGQTLSQVALHERPDLPVHDGVVAIQLTNGLSTEQVHAGQRLMVPAP